MSAGIAEALLTTAVGLAVAIVAVWFYNFFVTKLDAARPSTRRDRRRELADQAASSTRRGGRAMTELTCDATGTAIERPGGRAARPAARARAQARAPRSRARARCGDINVTPLVDVVLVLLIIFMVVTPLIASGVRGRPAAHRPPLAQARRRQGHHRLGHRGQALLQSAARVADQVASAGWSPEKRRTPEKTVFLKADSRAPYGAVRTVMQALHEAEIEDVMLGTEKSSSGEKP